MTKLLRAMFYRSRHDPVLWLLLALTFLICAMFWNGMNIRSIGKLEEQIEQSSLRAVAGAYGWEGEGDAPEEDKEAFFTYYVFYSSARMLREVNPVRLLSILAAAYLIGTLFTRRAVQAMLYHGHSRGGLVCAALAYYCLVIAFTLAASVCIFLLLKFGARAFPLFASPHFWGNLGLWLLLALSALAPQFALAFWIQNLFGTLLASFVLMLAAANIPTGGFRGAVFAGPFGDFLPYGIMEKETLWLSGGGLEPGKQALLLLIPAAILVSMALLAYFAFQKQDIR